MTIVGALLSLAVIVGAIVLTRQIRTLCRQLDADRKLARLELRPPDSPVPSPPKLTVLPYLRQRFRPYRAAFALGSGLLGILGTACLFVVFDPGSSAPAAQNPATTLTITTTVSPHPHTATVILDRNQSAVAATVIQTPLPMPMSPVVPRTPAPERSSHAPTRTPAGMSDRADTPPPSSIPTPPSSLSVHTTAPSVPTSSASMAVEPSP